MQGKESLRLSIIVYVLNSEEYIEECVRSLMQQTMREIEIIVVDGGSRDNTLTILEQLKAEDDRIILTSKSGGVGAQFNHGVSIARGDYIGVCEADDYVSTVMYEKEYQVAVANDLDVLRADYVKYFTVLDRIVQIPVIYSPQSDMYNRMIDCAEQSKFFFLNYGVNGYWNGIYKREFLNKNNIRMNETPGASYQDVTFSFLTQMFAGRIWFMNEPFYHYRLDNPSSSSNFKTGAEKVINEYNLLEGQLKRLSKWNTYKDSFIRWKVASFRWYITTIPEDTVERAIKDCKDSLYANLTGTDTDEINSLVRNFEREAWEANRTYNMKQHQIGLFRFEKPIAIFGCGLIGEMLLNLADFSNEEIVLVDNNETLWEGGFKGYNVRSPKDILLKGKDYTFVITSNAHWREIQIQLNELGVADENIIICNDINSAISLLKKASKEI